MSMQPLQPAFVMPAVQGEAYQAMQQGPVPQYASPEMMQGMQGMQAMPMQVVMGPGGPMMVAPMMPPGMVPPGAMAAPQLTQMLVDAARGGRSSNVFFKTRICNKWRAGACQYGQKCTYAHGEHELRYVPPEIVAQLEAQQKMQEAMQRGGGQSAGGEQQQQQQQHGEDAGGGQGGTAGGAAAGHPQSYYKTRLCIKFMQTGYCHKGASCTFAHGYEDLRQPGAPLSPLSPGRMPQDPMSPGRMAMAGGMPMMAGPGGMMAMALPPGAAMGPMAGGRGMPMPGGPGMGMGMPMPLPPGRYSGGGGPQQHGAARSPRAGGGGSYGAGGGGGREDPAGAARRRAAAMSQIAGVGEVSGEEAQPGAVQAALSDVRSGAAFRESPYADSVADFVAPQAGTGGAS